ncbi:NAD-dependent epimerase/dehydratase family protein [Stigmatella hybrida]|uniref:NAD-dependent epimerase/dehydratase family protein n=1 Tax=Stigmatella hybrida TaxID=394097 RepID=UPI001CDABA6B|nr:NAD-dependent epimerase/dehydratase family protein [Stigmatella hybrida]
MRIAVIGAAGFVGGALARHFAASGYEVSGLVRSAEAATRLQAEGIEPIAGDLASERALQTIVETVGRSDAVVFAPQLAPEAEYRAVSSLLGALVGTGKTFLFTSGTGVMLQRTAGAWSQNSFAEDDVFEHEELAAHRIETERLVRAAPSRGVRGIVLRPPLIWGPGDHGHVAMVYRSVGLTGAACYVGEGLASYSHVHIDDVCRLYGLALTQGGAGALYHAVGGEIPNRWIAEAVARDMRCETRSLSVEEASRVWGPFGALILSSSSRSRSPRSRAELGWTAERTDMLTMIGEPRLRALAARGTP